MRSETRTWPGYPRSRSDQLEQPIEIERLFQEGVGVHIGGARLVERRQDDHGHVGHSAVTLLLAAKLPAVHHRHHEVEENDVGGGICPEVTASASRPLDTVAAAYPSSVEQLRHHLSQVRIVFDDQNGTGGGGVFAVVTVEQHAPYRTNGRPIIEQRRLDARSAFAHASPQNASQTRRRSASLPQPEASDRRPLGVPRP